MSVQEVLFYAQTRTGIGFAAVHRIAVRGDFPFLFE